MTDRFLLFRREDHPSVSGDWSYRDGWWFLREADVHLTCGKSLQLRKGLFVTRPFFYSGCEELFVASTSWIEVVQTLRRYGIPVGCEAEFVWQYLESQCPLTNKTFCRNVYVLRCGEQVNYLFGRKPQASLKKYVPPAVEASREEPDLRKLLVVSLRELAMDNAGFHLSAGLDSSILIILARQLHPEASIKAFSCKTLGRGPGDELPNVHRLARDYRLDLTVYDFTQVDLLLEGRRLIETLHYPIAHPSHLTRFLLDDAISAEHMDYVVTGRGADESLAGYSWHLPEYADPRRHRERVLVTSRGLLQSIFKQEWQSAYFSKWARPAPLSLTERLQYDWWTLFESWNVIETSLERSFGLEYVNPFLRREFIETLIAMPAARLIAGNTSKSYLKKYFKHTYPQYILEYPKRGLTMDINAYFQGYSSREIMHAIFNDCDFAQRQLRRSAVEKLVEETLTGTGEYGWQVWSLYLASLASIKLSALGHQVYS
ncbi:asparagine synthase-related protein [Desulfoferrobacter suflitae]|uniref:asparagine synthase-related protein n=1 Tax=Desulfoferrobacter suflitae TaxID=2865782 RepID=UPI0021643074|nr:asparagine synthase C-terminal domain-containing protein [Desulfoferrobacter suflitae]MCK8603258.1 asparagine synthase C-terminal domain-containing protein [Desulfoferrobacter suflitae]